MNTIIKTFAILGLVFFVIASSCKKDTLTDNRSISSNQNNEGKINQPGKPSQLVTGLGSSTGSATGPGGDLFVPDSKAGTIVRINPKTGAYSTFADGLPQLDPTIDPNVGGITDVAFIGGTAYALVTLVDDPLFPTGKVNGIYRIDGSNNFKIIADIGAYNIAHPPTGIDFEVATGVLYAIQPYRNGFLVTDGHLNRVLYVTLNGEITVVKSFGDIVPTGLAVKGNQIFMSEAGPVPHNPEDGKVVSFNGRLPAVIKIASGAPLLVDVQFGHGLALFALSQGLYSGGVAGSPALPNTGSLVRVNYDRSFSVIADKLNIPTSFEIIGNTAYIITLGGEVWTVDNIAGPPFGE